MSKLKKIMIKLPKGKQIPEESTPITEKIPFDGLKETTILTQVDQDILKRANARHDFGNHGYIKGNIFILLWFNGIWNKDLYPITDKIITSTEN